MKSRELQMEKQITALERELKTERRRIDAICDYLKLDVKKGNGLLASGQAESKAKTDAPER